MALYHLPSPCVSWWRKEQRCSSCSLMDYQAVQVKLSSALICLDMGKGNEELNLSKDISKSASKKKHCCVNPGAPVCVFGPFQSQTPVERKCGETMKRWGHQAPLHGSQKEGPAGSADSWESLLIFYFCTPQDDWGAAMEPLARSPRPAQEGKGVSSHLFHHHSRKSHSGGKMAGEDKFY